MSQAVYVKIGISFVFKDWTNELILLCIMFSKEEEGKA